MKPRGYSGAAKPDRRRTETSAQERPPDGTGGRTRQRAGGVEASEAEQGQPRHRRDDRGRAAGVPGGELGEDSGAAARRDLPAQAGEAAGRYRRRGGGVRELGIPTVLDRFIQQAMLQVLQPMFDPTFSEHSYGFRPGRSAHQAVCAAQRYIQAGRRVVVDVDLEKFFDRVNHDVLMGRLAKRIEDKRVLGLIRRYLEAGIMANGVVMERYEGTPQGGPLVTAAGQRAAGRSGQGAGEARACLRALRRRPERLRRSKRAGERVPWRR